MKTIKQQIEELKSTDTFYITYYAKKHKEEITRHGTWTKPNTDIKGKHVVMNGKDVFFYWDLKAPPNENGNKWRQATNPTKLERVA